MTNKNFKSHISLHSLYPKLSTHPIYRYLLSFGDKVMGLRKLDAFYLKSGLAGLTSEEFAEGLVSKFNTPLIGAEELHKKLPKTGPVIIVANHPFGCLEGIALAREIKKARKDVKVLANKALSMFEELKPFFIFIDPLRPKDPKNMKALKDCRRHLNQNGVLVLFPSGKVSEYEPDKQRICDAQWNRLPAQLARSCNADVLPIFFEGNNSKRFILLARVWSKLKLLMLFREMMNRQNVPINMRVGNLLSPVLLSKLKDVEVITAYLRAQTYALKSVYQQSWPKDKITGMLPLAKPINKSEIAAELEALPNNQKLASYKGFSVYYGYQRQISNIVLEIARERERVFRLHNEGSGQPIDTDKFDATYVHLFIIEDNSLDLIGAYRMGQTDILLKEGGLENLYLSKMFSFKQSFVNQQEPCLEMGRSFIVPEHQKSFYGLYLLWRGIGEFVVKYPRYRTLYGTVSISKLYDPRSVEYMRDLLTQPSQEVDAITPFNVLNNPELVDFTSKHREHFGVLSALVSGTESDGKDIPILIKQYQKLAARFYCIGIDTNFNDTPGMLLSVHLPSAPQKSLKQYLTDGLDGYLAFNKEN
ncbi:lysophospholipid acyltransferase family protein [Psychrosphaera sp.]|nr:lysophospholipid acyltransferase family protein [Psychrosphaera sp.]